MGLSAVIVLMAVGVYLCFLTGVCVFVLAGTVRVERGHAEGHRALLVASTDVWGQGLDPQLRTVLQWMAASITELQVMQLSQQSEREVQQVRFSKDVSYFKLALYGQRFMQP